MVSSVELADRWEMPRTEYQDRLKAFSDQAKSLTASVVIPAHNLESVIAVAIQSVLSQSVQPIEIIVSDDGSSDNTVEIAQSFGVTVLSGIKANGNVARNRGIRHATGEIVMMLDGDDWWHRDKVRAHLLTHAAKPKAAFIFDPAEVVENGINANRIIGDLGDQNPDWERFLNWRAWASGSSFSFRRSRLEERPLSYFNESLIALQDVDFWLRATHEFGPAYRLDAPFTYYRISAGTVSRKPRSVAENLQVALDSWTFLSASQKTNFRRQTFLTAARFCTLRNGMPHLVAAGFPFYSSKLWKSLARMTLNSIRRQ